MVIPLYLTALVKNIGIEKKLSVQETAQARIANDVRKSHKQEKSLACMELNLGNGKKEVVLIKEGDNYSEISERIGKKYG